MCACVCVECDSMCFGEGPGLRAWCLGGEVSDF